MTHTLAFAVEIATSALAVAGIAYFFAAILAARIFITARRTQLAPFAPSVSILKSLKGVDPAMLDAFRSHCRQNYAGAYELIFGVSSLTDPAVVAVEQLQREFPEQTIRLIECPLLLGANGKVSTLAQLLPHAQHEFLLISDSDISVSPHYLERIMIAFSRPALTKVADTPLIGLVTALYRGNAHRTLPSRLEALAIATDFQPSVLLSKWLEGGIRYGLGSTLAVRREALDRIGGFAALVDYLADDYELGARIAKAGYTIALSSEVVETGTPPYTWGGFVDHQLRWLRTVRDARPAGYTGLIFTYGFAWAVLNVLASGVSPLSLWLLGLSFFLRLTLAMTVGAEVLGDHEVLPNLWLLPMRDLIALGLWVAAFASNTIVWRGQHFAVHKGVLHRIEGSSAPPPSNEMGSPS
ncbi:MAG TPA: bacteriohopanetetrol glucosamine biosynthesis glycosyltransferase HpnI [Terracidiphilus sp.]|jgi:ceramide glucosyltransferase|nr:bacteriohopanetetrol glucosamine biosynthesis glycosyltransferase HpnI [Terracidiphilus sp.]